MKNISDKLTKTSTETSKENNKALENINNQLLETLNDRGILATYLMSLLSKITNPEKTSQFKLVKGSSSKRVNDVLIDNTITLTINNILLTFHHTGK